MNSEKLGQVGKSTIFFDGSCELCRVATQTIGSSSKKDSFSMTDVTSGVLPEGVTRSAAESGVHLVDADGVIYSNLDAVLKILDAYPLWRPFTALCRTRICKPVFSYGYRFVAKHRHFFSVPILFSMALLLAGMLLFLILMLIKAVN